MPRKPYFWTEEKDDYLRKNYPHKLNSELAKHFNTTEKGIRKRAERLKLKKTSEQIQKARKINRKNNDKNNKKNKKGKTVMEKKMAKENDRPIVEIEREEVVEHKIKLDEYIEMRLKIPKELDAIEFASILEKARKMLRLSEIEVGTVGSLGKKKYVTNVDEKVKLLEEYSDLSGKEEKAKLAKKYGYSSVSSLVKSVSKIRINLKGAEYNNGKDDMEYFEKREKQKELVDRYNRCSSKEERTSLANEIGTTLSRLQARICYYKKDVTGKSVKSGRGIWTAEKISTLRNLVAKGLKSKEISKTIGFDRRTVGNKVYNLRISGDIPKI